MLAESDLPPDPSSQSRPGKAPAFQFYAKDWLTSEAVRGMSFAERGLFIDLLAHAWDKGGLPKDEHFLRRLAGAEPREWKRIWPAVREEFEEQDGRLINPKQEAVREALRLRVEAGRVAATTRWRPENDATTTAQRPHNDPTTTAQRPNNDRATTQQRQKYDRLSGLNSLKNLIGDPAIACESHMRNRCDLVSPTQCSASASAFASSFSESGGLDEPQNKERPMAIRRPSRRSVRPDELDGFPEFYAAYPRKVKPDAARRAWRKISSDVTTRATIMASLGDWIRHWREFATPVDKIPYPASWLNGGAWRSDLGADREWAAGTGETRGRDVDRRLDDWLRKHGEGGKR